MRFRVATLNLEQDHKRWDARRPLIVAEIGRLKPDVMALNEICVPRQSARGLRASAAELTGIDYGLVQQTKVNGLSEVEGEAGRAAVRRRTAARRLCDPSLQIARRGFAPPFSGAATAGVDRQP